MIREGHIIIPDARSEAERAALSDAVAGAAAVSTDGPGNNSPKVQCRQAACQTCDAPYSIRAGIRRRT